MIDYNKPIIAVDKDSKFLLIPTLDNGYKVKGYDWLNLKTMKHNSCCHFETKESAVTSYRNSYKIYNAKVVKL